MTASRTLVARLEGRMEQLELQVRDARANLHGWEYQRDQVSLKLKQMRAAIRAAQERKEDAP